MNKTNDGDAKDNVWHGEGSIVVFAKCPIPGKSKTRLIPLLGEEGSVQLAKGMLSDVLKSINGCAQLNGTRKILVYAPGTPAGKGRMEDILDGLGLATNKDDDFASWHLLPMMSKPSDLRSNDLGAKLEDALERVRLLEGIQHRGVVFLGMDAPILPLTDIVSGLEKAAVQKEAVLCPAMDGGYAMLCVPDIAVPSRTFRNMYWSHPWTGMSQAKAITDQGIKLSIGTVVRDIDETRDVQELCSYLGIEMPSSQSTTMPTDDNDGRVKCETKNLELPSGRASWLPTDLEEVATSHPTCHFTRKALLGAFTSSRNE